MSRRMVLVDIDGTLFGGMNSEVSFMLYLLRRRKLGPRQLLSACWFFLRWAPRYGRHVAKRNKAYLNGLKVTEVRALAECFVREALMPKVRPIMLQRLSMHRQAGDTVVLLSGTLQFIAEPLCRALNLDDWSATRCTEQDGVLTSRPPLAHPFGKEKLQHGAQLCRRHRLSLTKAVAYADSGYDLALLSYVARPVAVDPDHRLERVAREQGWEIIDPQRGPRLDTALGM